MRTSLLPSRRGPKTRERRGISARDERVEEVFACSCGGRRFTPPHSSRIIGFIYNICMVPRLLVNKECRKLKGQASDTPLSIPFTLQ
ncbi:frizzled-10-A [Biomphalaria glabrata]|nr:frizzled-10-A [Biomphalaria glabrata]